ncbi:glycerophosphodiester phosphodiesterase family protein [Acidianus sp. RZ1]|uniref:glycerophosphodiester phosphodiesterase n=1 Tax=Acidianus sp. RZ1 TaxID=1540082 RepID=UPI001492926C|nr:glycerophosphodiester phosphodiesterase family protein [Acidianus sp. RZ1]NON63378.1 glycerophosphodiester phosphodiesterase [Acidianus sp. RZ1]
MRPYLIAHRGLANAPENTLPSFEMAIREGIDGFELDVQQTKDAKIVVMHSGSVNLTTDGRGLIKFMTAEEVRSLDAGIKFGWKGIKVPFLEEVLDKFGNSLIEIEIKHGSRFYPNIEERVLKTVKDRKMLEQVKFISFDITAIHKILRLENKTITGLAVIGRPEWYLKILKNLGITWIHVNYRVVGNLEGIHKEGIMVSAGIVNDERIISKMIDIGVDEITSDYPDKLSKFRSGERFTSWT